MDSIYEELGFKYHEIQNSCGIKILVGTKGKEDWCIIIPKYLVKKQIELSNNPKFKGMEKYIQDFNEYCVSEERVLWLAKQYTDLAMK